MASMISFRSGDDYSDADEEDGIDTSEYGAEPEPAETPSLLDIARNQRMLAERVDRLATEYDETIASLAARISNLEASREAQAKALKQIRDTLHDATRQNDAKLDELAATVEQARVSINRLNEQRAELRESSRVLTENWDRLSATVKELQDARRPDLEAYDKKLGGFYDRLSEQITRVGNRLQDHLDREIRGADEGEPDEDTYPTGVTTTTTYVLNRAEQISRATGVPAISVLHVIAYLERES